jgi:NAD(P)-dependent dehydrogenase (short-subunit alcohol dehydrogenase family)
MTDLKNKCVIVTGGGSGMGQAAAILFARPGAKVTVGSLHEEKGRATVEKIHRIRAI